MRLRMSNELASLLARRADLCGMTQAEIVRRSMRRWCGMRERPPYVVTERFGDVTTYGGQVHVFPGVEAKQFAPDQVRAIIRWAMETTRAQPPVMSPEAEAERRHIEQCRRRTRELIRKVGDHLQEAIL